MSTVAKAEVRTARQRAGQIRQGIHNYLETLALIAVAWEEQDWRTLAYDSWDAYVNVLAIRKLLTLESMVPGASNPAEACDQLGTTVEQFLAEERAA